MLMDIFHSGISLQLRLSQLLRLFLTWLLVATMSATGLEQDHSTGTWIREENVESWFKLCFMLPPRTEKSFGTRLTMACSGSA
nr:hypothetical protein Iba_chr07fCG10730 [Ipomoea batatas]